MQKSELNILLVEDNPGDVRLLREGLQEIDARRFNLTHVETLTGALDCLGRSRFDVGVLDLDLPDARGLEVVRRIQDVAPEVPLLVLTALSDEALAIQSLQEGAQDYLVKAEVDSRSLWRALRYAMERHHLRLQLVSLSLHDVLTGLPNRQLFSDRLRQALAHAKRHGGLMAVLYLDVDRLKAVNDALGHAVGDRLLQCIAERLRLTTRAQDTVARLSGDEFAIVVTELGAAEDGELVAAKHLQVLREPLVLDGHEINVSCSIGVAVFPVDADNETALLRAADEATYYAKQFRNTSHRYSSDIERTPPEALLAFSSVRRAIEKKQLEVHYQPLVLASTRALHGFEALVRWCDPASGLKSTPELIRAAEDAGLIAAVTDHVLGVAMRQVLEWQRHGCGRGGHLAVNISGVQMRGGALIPMVQRHLHETGFDPSLLELEITESTAMRTDPTTMAILMQLKQLGIRLSVDDFGTGYSSLSRLQRLPVDALKIDKSFVHGIERDDDAGAIARAIIVMAHSLRLAVTAEGVETQRQLEFLEAHGCDRLQGYLFSPPLPAAEMANYLGALTTS